MMKKGGEERSTMRDPTGEGCTRKDGRDTKQTVDVFDAEAEFRKVYEKAVKLGLTGEDFAKMEVLNTIKRKGSYLRLTIKYTCISLLVCLLMSYGCLVAYTVGWPVGQAKLASVWFWVSGGDVDNDICMVEMPEFVNDLFRPPVDCDFCENLTQVETVYNISSVKFEELYGYSGVPVVIGDGTLNWTATDYFSFEFFKELYQDGSVALDNQIKNCQFFPYKTAFKNLKEVMTMSPERAKMADGSEPWYIGWSNCDFSAANTLRKHYRRPYFLPMLSESSKTDWIFMGSPGYGAHLHIDNVGHPSWQAQITGTKRWTLEPPPECYYTCKDQIEVTVQPGQIIVLDTNIWYHSTLNVGEDISITIGSEYD